MKFKTAKVEDEFHSLDEHLQLMGTWLDQLSQIHFGIEITITRVLEFIKGDSGVHEIRHAFDVRDEFGAKAPFAKTYTEEQARFLASEMNRRFRRSDRKPTCLHHSFAGGPKHLHVQWNPLKTKDQGPDPEVGPDLNSPNLH